MATRMQQRRGTAAQWSGANPILAAGEIGFETDTSKFKIGNGSSTWSALNYYVDANAILDGAPGVLDTLNELAAALGDDPEFITTVATNLSTHAADTSDVHGIANTANLATLNDLSEAISNAEVDQSTLAGVGLDWNAGTEQFDIDDTVVTLTGTQSLTNKTLNAADLGSSSIATTQDGADSSTKIATTAFVQQRVSAVVAGAPELLNTLNELSIAIANDQNFSATITELVGQKLVKAGDTMTGFLTLSGAPVSDLHAATKLYVDTKSSTEATGAVSAHTISSTNVHGIADVGELATKSYADNAATTAATGAISDHTVLSTNVHGIANVEELATKAYADSSSTAAATSATETHRLDTTNVHGIVDTANVVLTDDARLSDTRTPTDNTVSTDKIVNSSVTAVKLAGDSVTTAKIEDGAVTSAKIADGAIVNADINDSAAIAWTKLASSSTISETELGYLDGVSSNIQTQFTGVTAAIATAKAEAIADATSQVNAILASAPAALDTLDELAAALGDDANFASSVTTSLELKVDSITPIVQKTASYTMSSLTERDDLIEMNSSSALTLTIPTNASVAFPVGTSFDVLQTGSGQVTIAGASGVTVNATPGLKLRTQYSSATCFKRAENLWVVYGDLTA